MKNIVLAGLVLGLWPEITAAHDPHDPSRRQVYHSLQQPQLGDSSYVVDDSIRLQFPDLEVHLVSGQLAPLYDHAGALTGWLFDGKARVCFAPRHEIERQQLHRFTRDSVWTGNVAQILWRFVQDSFEAWMAGDSIPDTQAHTLFNAALSGARLQRVATRVCAEAAALPNFVQKEWLQRRGFNLASSLLREKHAARSSFVVCAFVPELPKSESPPLYLYLYDPRAPEAIQFLQYHEKALKRPFYTLCSYPLERYFAAPAVDSVRLTKYNGWVEIQPNGQLTADMGVDIYTARRKLPALFFSLAPDLIVSRVTAEQGDTLDFVQETNEAGITVFLPDKLTPVDTLRLLFHYAGKILVKNASGVLFLKDAVFWVPRLGYLRRAAYKIIFKSPKTLRVMAVGNLLREWEEGDYRHSYYSEPFPAKAASFCLGRFVAETIRHEGLPLLEIYSSSSRLAEQRRHVASDIANSLYLFNRLIAPYSAPALRIVEAPGFVSHGYPGLVTLSWLGFQTHGGGVLEALRSHEVAHQWFGNAVGWATYHDQWLSEGFAEYLGALYVEWVIQDRRNFTNLIQSWHDDFLERGHIGVALGLHRFGLGKEPLRKVEGPSAGPLWLGARLGQRDEMDYFLPTYRKGAYVVHTLRWLLRDLTTGSDDKFWTFLADFARTYWGADPSTRDLQKTAEKHFGAPLDWFFKQWVYGTAIPTYRCSYRVEKSAAGNIAQISIQQEDVPPDFRMPVPVVVEYDDGVRIGQRLWVDRHGAQFKFAPRAASVRKVNFNEGKAVLCRIK